MAFDPQSTQEINDIIIAQLEASFNQTIPLLPKAFNRVLAKVVAGVFVTLYKYGGFVFLQIFVQTASIKDTVINGVTVSPLTEWGRLIGIGDPSPATNAEMTVDITVTNQTGSIASNSPLVNADNGVTYITIGAVALSAPVVSATIRAVSDQSDGGGAGVIGNLEIGDTVTFANPLPNISRDTVVTAQTVTAADGETTEAYRGRIIDRFQKRPQGGAYADYEQWGEEPSGIINVYPYTSETPGIVDVYVEATPASSGNPDGIPTTPQLQEVFDSIELDDNGLATRRPATALQNILAITRTEFLVDVANLVVTNPTEVQSDITEAIEEYFLGREPFIIGLSILPRQDRITRTGVDGITDSIVSSFGGTYSGVVVMQAGVPINIYSLGVGEKSKGVVSFV